jgi:hypothetical protein
VAQHVWHLSNISGFLSAAEKLMEKGIKMKKLILNPATNTFNH